LKSESLNLLKPSGPVQARNRDCFLIIRIRIRIRMRCNNNFKRKYTAIFGPKLSEPPGDPD
jgi:hypothetical protein